MKLFQRIGEWIKDSLERIKDKIDHLVKAFLDTWNWVLDNYWSLGLVLFSAGSVLYAIYSVVTTTLLWLDPMNPALMVFMLFCVYVLSLLSALAGAWCTLADKDKAMFGGLFTAASIGSAYYAPNLLMVLSFGRLLDEHNRHFMQLLS